MDDVQSRGVRDRRRHRHQQPELRRLRGRELQWQRERSGVHPVVELRGGNLRCLACERE